MNTDHFKNKGFATRAIHAGFDHCEQTGAVMPPIYLATTFAQTEPGKPIGQFEYTRTNNPSRSYLEAALASLENGQHGICFSSGCAALQTLLSAIPQPYHIIVSDDIYGGSLRLINTFALMGVKYDQVDMTHPENVTSSITDQTKLIWLETPSNPLLKVIDIQAIKDCIKDRNIILAVDNTFASPYLQTPLNLGADVVCHSTTKYIGGHSDILGGALITNHDDLAQTLRFFQNAFGAVPSPMDCYLLLRSLKTLAVRMQQHCSNAKVIAAHLDEHSKIAKVYYPGLNDHPQFMLAKKQMHDFGGMMSVVLKGEKQAALNFLKKLQIFTLAESLGGVESLIEHPATMTHAAVPAEHRRKIGIEDTLVRISVGIEDANDLIADLEQALR